MKTIHSQRLLDAQKALVEALNDNSSHPLNKTISPGGAELIPSVLYFTAEGTNNKTIKFVDSGKSKTVGIQNFKKDMLDSNEPFVVTHIAVLVGKEPTTGGKSIEAASYDDAAPGEVRNAELIISQDGRGKIAELLVDALHNPNTTRTQDERFKELEFYPVILDDKEFQVEMNCPANIPNDSKYFIKVVAKGYKLKR